MKKALFLLILLALFVVLMTSCSNFVAPEGSIRFTPPPQYKIWWNQIQPCVDKPQKRSWNEIEWYYLDGYVYVDDVKAAGYTHNNKIFISSWYVFEDDGSFRVNDDDAWIIQHELVHAISKISGHPYDPFYICGLMPHQQHI